GRAGRLSNSDAAQRGDKKSVLSQRDLATNQQASVELPSACSSAQHLHPLTIRLNLRICALPPLHLTSIASATAGPPTVPVASNTPCNFSTTMSEYHDGLIRRFCELTREPPMTV